jgi:DegV family protein with EDD domain
VKRVRIVTDSVADIPAALARELDITVVACQVYFGQEVYRDGVDLSPEAFFDKLARSPVLPHTSQPPIGHFLDTYQTILAADPSVQIISIHVPGVFSGTVSTAWAAAQMLSNPSCVEVIDSGLVSMGMGWVVIEAARKAQSGATRAEVSQYMRMLLSRSRTAAMIDTLENLYKGGRISQISAILGTALQIKPLLSIHDSKVTVWGKVRTRSRALKRLVAEVQSWGAMAEMTVLHGGAEELAYTLTEQLQGMIPADRMLVIPAGAALITHLGLGAVGVCGLIAD